ncbi:hypothetical protein BDV32DRAFT_88320 [Aspergillus pseudonomiae]|nr:hypothetical protein BDV32DRAFT_88320 [Aspergillus pseudonomiae]
MDYPVAAIVHCALQVLSIGLTNSFLFAPLLVSGASLRYGFLSKLESTPLFLEMISFAYLVLEGRLILTLLIVELIHMEVL